MSERIGRTAVITGGTSGIGAAAADRLRADGLHVITLDLGGGADWIVDVRDRRQVAEAAAGIGPVDVLVNSAGLARLGNAVWETSDDEWDALIAVNLTGTFNVCRAFVPGMIENGWGRVVNVSGMAGKEGNALAGAYSASKAGVIALTKTLGKELAATGVLANAIAPGVIDTPMSRSGTPGGVASLVEKIPMGRMGTSAEAAELIAFLSSDRVSFSTGFTYDLSGGRATY